MYFKKKIRIFGKKSLNMSTITWSLRKVKASELKPNAKNPKKRDDAGLEVKHVLIWVKNSPTFSMGRLDYDYKHEPILYTWTKTHKRKKEGEFNTSIWLADKPRANKEHPTMKPVALPANALLNHSDEGDIIADIYLGSGTTMVAAHQLKRVCYGMEISPNYCQVIIDRMRKLDPSLTIKKNGIAI
jgi:DNA modification methylase